MPAVLAVWCDATGRWEAWWCGTCATVTVCFAEVWDAVPETVLFVLAPRVPLLCAEDIGVVMGSSRAIESSIESPVPFRCWARLFNPTLPILEPRFTLEFGLDGPIEPRPSSSQRVSFCCICLGTAALIFSAFSGYRLYMFR